MNEWWVALLVGRERDGWMMALLAWREERLDGGAAGLERAVVVTA